MGEESGKSIEVQQLTRKKYEAEKKLKVPGITLPDLLTKQPNHQIDRSMSTMGCTLIFTQWVRNQASRLKSNNTRLRNLKLKKKLKVPDFTLPDHLTKQLTQLIEKSMTKTVCTLIFTEWVRNQASRLESNNTSVKM